MTEQAPKKAWTTPRLETLPIAATRGKNTSPIEGPPGMDVGDPAVVS